MTHSGYPRKCCCSSAGKNSKLTIIHYHATPNPFPSSLPADFPCCINFLFLIATSGLFLYCNSQSRQDEFPIFLQEDISDCGPVCLKMIGEYYGIKFDLNRLRELSGATDGTGASLAGLSEAADSMGLKNLGVKITYEVLVETMPLPSIVHWNANHFVVVYQADSARVFVADPAMGKLEYSKAEFCKHWMQGDNGIALIFELKK